MLEPTAKKDLLNRLRRISGQMRGLEQLIETDRDVGELVRQLKAVEKAVHAALYDALDNHLRLKVAEQLSTRLAACPGDCSDAERLQLIRREFAQLDLKGVLASLEWLSPD